MKGANKMKNFYIGVTVKENEKYFSYAIKATDNDNLLSVLKIKGIVWASLSKTKKDCEGLIAAWNEQFKVNGTHMYEREG